MTEEGGQPGRDPKASPSRGDGEEAGTGPLLPDAAAVTDAVGWSRWMGERLFTLLMACFVALLVSVTGNVLLFLKRTPPAYFATTSDGRVLPMVPLSDPLRSSRWLLTFASRTAVDALTMDFVNWRRTFARIRRRFSPQAYEDFYRAFETGGMKALVLDRQMVVSAVPENAPVIVATGVLSGRRAWKIQIPMTVSYSNGAGTTPKRYVVTMMVARVPTTINPYGVAVTQFVLAEG